jgi:iron(III) transport system ATP-binding protein
MAAHVAIDGVTKRYSAAADSGGVFDINVVIPGGKFTTLLGESGSGKTTLLRLLAGFLRPSEGTIFLGDIEIASNKMFVPPQARDLAMVFQSYALWPHMTVFDNVAFGLRSQKTPKREILDRVETTLSLVGLEELQHRKPAQLSGGQQQRVALARSLVLEPGLLLLDEPLSNLDADLRVQMRDQLKALQVRTGITFVYVTHDQEEAFALSDHMIVLDQGRILQQGPCEEIYSRPRSNKVAEFMGRRGLHLDGALDSKSQFSISAPSGGKQVLGTFPHVDNRLANGGKATLVVHSESLRLEAPGATSECFLSVPGVVESTSFAGRENQVVVRTGGDHSTTAYAPIRENWAPGETVQMSFRPESSWVFPTGRAGAGASGPDSEPDLATTDVADSSRSSS